MVKLALTQIASTDVRNRISFALRRGMSEWGVPGITTLLLAFALAIVLIFWVWPAARRLDVLEARAIDSSSPPMALIVPATIIDNGGLGSFYKNFPPESLILDITGQINQLADHSGMRIIQADYRASDDRSGVIRYDMTVSGKGSYPQLRTFTAECLTRFPTLSLEAITLSRTTVTESIVEAQFRFSVYLRGT